ncbi:MAG: hypothetical protein GKR77_03200 [Legionellales bacterium]|nr:hypothetical protein [Legionellales bacterium]
MMGNFVNFIRALPIGVLLILPIVLTGLLALIIKRDWGKAWRTMVCVTLMIGITAGFYFWHMYLIQHFVGRFDVYGLPTELYRSGLYLLIDAWPIWVFPTALVIGGSFIWLWQFKREHLASATSNAPPPHDLSLQLEVQKLKQQLLIAREKLHQARATSPKSSKMQQLKQDNIQRDLNSQIDQLQHENQQLHEHTLSLESDLARAKSLIERLLDDQLETND